MLAYGETGPGEKTLVVRGFSAAGSSKEPTRRIRDPVREVVRRTLPGVGAGRPAARDDRARPRRADRRSGRDDPPGRRRCIRPQSREAGILTLRWSPDGSQLALLVPYSYPREEVWLVPADGGAAHLLPGFDREADTSGIAWTADGRSVVAAGSGCCPQRPPFVEVVDVTTGSTHEVPLPETWHQLRVRGDRRERGRPLPRVARMGPGAGMGRSPGERHPREARATDDVRPHAVPGWSAAPLRDVSARPSGAWADAHRGPARRRSGDEVLALDRRLR